ncbi:MAG: hypothetical protein HYR74_11605 [Candidatus Eisenbacteria bacterium]|nr:hypothetical protein [Candidatus Eisenbacteria bacterium]
MRKAIGAALVCGACAIGAPPDAAHADRASARLAEPAAIPRFTTFGWVSPPIAFTTPERYAELAGAGMNVAITAWDDPHTAAENLHRMDCAAAAGVRCLVADDRFDRVAALGFTTPAAGALLDSIVHDYRDHPGFLGYYFRDEPKSPDWPGLASVFAELRRRDPDHPAWDNLSGIGDSASWVADNTGYVEHVHPAVLCNDHYDFRIGFDYGLFIVNIAGLRAWSLRYGIPFWCAIQLVPHANLRTLTEGEVTWQVAMLLAYGARGLGYFTYWTPAPDSTLHWGLAIVGYDAVRTPWYDVIARLNARARPAGELLAGLTWISSQHAGSLPLGGAPFRGDDWIAGVGGRAAIGRFTDAAGVPYAVVVNSDSLAARVVTLDLAGAGGASRFDERSRGWTPLATAPSGGQLRLSLALAAGDFAVLRIEGTFARRGAIGPALAVAPNPARGAVRFDVDRLAGGARLDVIDAGGRKIFSRALAAGRASLAWNGERDAGGAAPAGVYLAVVRDARGMTARRWTWLGPR